MLYSVAMDAYVIAAIIILPILLLMAVRTTYLILVTGSLSVAGDTARLVGAILILIILVVAVAVA